MGMPAASEGQYWRARKDADKAYPRCARAAARSPPEPAARRIISRVPAISSAERGG